MSLLFINQCLEKLSGSINFNGDKFCAACNKRIYNFSKENTLKAILAISLIVLISFASFAQQKIDSTKVYNKSYFTVIPSDTNQSKNAITISGIITNVENEKPLDFFRIHLIDENNIVVDGAFTQEDGSFKFKIPKSDSMKILRLEIGSKSFCNYSVAISKEYLMKDLFIVRLQKKVN